MQNLLQINNAALKKRKNLCSGYKCHLNGAQRSLKILSFVKSKILYIEVHDNE